MSYHAFESCDADGESVNLHQRSFTSSVFNNASNFKVNEDTDGGMTCASQPCCVHQERQLATPTQFWGNCSDGVEWIQCFEEIAQANNWSPKAKLDIVPIYLAGKSDKTWYRENRDEWVNFDSFKLAFIARYGTGPSRQLVDEFRTEFRPTYYDKILGKMPHSILILLWILQITIPPILFVGFVYKMTEILFWFIS
jgi:hypothetical protein